MTFPLTEQEKKDRRDSWGIYRYRPTQPTRDKPHINDQVGFHQSLAKIRVIIGPNRAGKTTPSVAEFGGLVLNEDYPDWWGWSPNATPKSPLTLWLSSPILPESVASDARLKRLFIGFWLTDPLTGERTWTPPLIPPSHLKDPGVLERSRPRIIETVAGDVFVIKSSRQAPEASAGEEPDLILVDEPTEPGVWYEYVGRVSQRPESRIIHVLTDASEGMKTDYLDYLKGAEHEGLVEFFRFTDANPHIDNLHHEQVLSLLPPEQKRIRRGGETTAEVRRCYPFANRWHKDRDQKKPEILNPYGGRGNWIPKDKCFPIPSKWTRYVIHDPGITNAAAAAWIAAEPGLNNLYIYRGLYVPEPPSDLMEMCRMIFEMTGDDQIRTFFIDPKSAKFPMQWIGNGPKEMKRLDLYDAASSRLTGRRFRWAKAPASIERMKKESRIAALTAYLNTDNGSCPNMWFFDDGSFGMEHGLKFELDKYQWGAAAKGRTNNPVAPVDKHNHFIYCIEVAAAMQLGWFPDDGDSFSVIPRKVNPVDPDGYLGGFMDGGFAEDFGKQEWL